MPGQLVTAPSVEPVSLAEAKLHLRVETSMTDDDTLIQALIVSARTLGEQITRRAFITQQWKLVLDQFPAPGQNIGSANWYGPQWGNSPGPLTVLRSDGRTGFEIFLDHAPLASVDSIGYTDTDGVLQTLSPSLYKVDSVSEPCRVVPAYGTTWPGTRNEINSVTVTYTCGYGATAASVPEPIKSWIKLRIGAMYENREEFATGRSIVAIEMPFIDGLLQNYRVQTY
jgi:uncharacterized phiE125 gp8 family phage protein